MGSREEEEEDSASLATALGGGTRRENARLFARASTPGKIEGMVSMRRDIRYKEGRLV